MPKILLGLLLELCAVAGYAADQPLLPSLPVGESLEYSIHWGLVPAGHTTISCTSTNEGDRKLVSIRIRARSNWLASTMFPVNDDVQCLVDPDTRLPVRVIKETEEDEFVCRDTLTFDRTENRAYWHSKSASIVTNYPIDANALDAVSFLFAMRELPFTLDETRDFSLAVDGQVHQLAVTAVKHGHHKIKGVGKVRTTCFEAKPRTKGLFVRKIPERIWLSETEPRVVTKMTGKVPGGTFRMVLENASPTLKLKQEQEPSRL